MFNSKFDFIIKEEIFRQYIAERFPLLLEEPDNHPELHKWFMRLDSKTKSRIVTEINTIFLYNLSEDQRLQKSLMKNYLRDERLCLNILLYVSGKPSLIEYFKEFVVKIYINYILKGYLNPKGFFGRSPMITGNKELDAIILDTVSKEFQRDLYSKDIKDLPSDFNSIISDLETHLEQILNNHETQIRARLKPKENLTEGFIDSYKIEKLLNSVLHLFNLNNATIKSMRKILKGMNKQDMLEIAAGGRSNTSVILSLGVMRRTAELLDNIKFSDPILDKMLKLIGYRLISENSSYFEPLKKHLSHFIHTKLREKTHGSKNIFSKMSAKKAKFAGHGNH